MEELIKIIKDLKKVCADEELDIGPEVFFEQCMKLYISNRIGHSKFPNIWNNNPIVKKEEVMTRNAEVKDTKKPTDKQLALLKKFKINSEGISRYEATQILAEKLK